MLQHQAKKLESHLASQGQGSAAQIKLNCPADNLEQDMDTYPLDEPGKRTGLMGSPQCALKYETSKMP